MKTYRGSPAAARNYVEADRGRADDYYLAEGTGIAERYVASPEAGVRRVAPLSGDAYEAWVAGVDPVTGVPKGRLRHNDQAVRFVEVTVNGPKSWSLAAEMHPDIGAAYDAAQDRAAIQTIGWLAQHATTRVGPRGQQVQVPVEQIEAAVVRHYTSRAGDPHRHLHLQVNARVFAAGTWRGLHTVGVRDSLDAINGIGHAAVAADPAFRRALAAHGFTLDEAGEIAQLAPFVGAFSARAAQITRTIEGYEADWIAAHPGETPGPALRRSWDARAWADGRPDKIHPAPGTDLNGRWRAELAALGYTDPGRAVPLERVSVGSLDRDQAVEEVLTRLAAKRSGWNAPDVRGEVELLLARRGIVTEEQVRLELAEDLTARTVAVCVPLLDRAGVPEHIRALTSQRVLEVETDLVGRLAARGTAPLEQAVPDPTATPEGDESRLDQTQTAAAHVLAGTAGLVVIEGAAGAGKTTTLSTARDLLAVQDRRLMVVSPTLKAAKVAEAELGARAGSAAWLVFQHGYRWDAHGAWTRLQPGQADPATGRFYRGPAPAAVLRAGDLLLVDEAGMLDQDTARALLTVADEQQVRVALMGDRHQLSAVGRGGVLNLAARWVDPGAHVTLDRVHRFTHIRMTLEGRREVVPDVEYAQLSLAMRTGENPDDVFTALLERGQIRVHDTDAQRRDALADLAAADITGGVRSLVVADTRGQVAELNAAIRDRLVTAGHVDDTPATTTGAGQRIGVGDRIVSRHNDTNLDVANRDTWTVVAVAADGALQVTGHPAGTSGGHTGSRQLPAEYVAEHVELGYASTVHGVQGDTADAGHLVLGEHTGAASAYVGMTRGRNTNTAHLVADTLDDARAQWVAVFARDRADLGAGHAAELAAQQAANYAEPRPLADVLADLRGAWFAEDFALTEIGCLQPDADRFRAVAALRAEHAVTLPALERDHRQARDDAARTSTRAEATETVMARDAEQIRAALQRDWTTQRPAARAAAHIVAAGPGRLRHHSREIADAHHTLETWAAGWRPYLPSVPTSPELVVRFAAGDHPAAVADSFADAARRQSEQLHPEHAAARLAAEQAQTREQDTATAWQQAGTDFADQLRGYGEHVISADPTEPAARADRLNQRIVGIQQRLAAARTDIDALTREPALLARPAGRVTNEHSKWELDRHYARTAQIAGDEAAAAERRRVNQRNHDNDRPRTHQPDHGPGFGR